ncbi:hypothetical protein POTOM_053284 [Populus tomentosa]|uniref:Prohibitin n=1 Tax=Populus tomentosa TaxID=118781 RepID=A0A8X7Y5M7_POPTO|nr:hypothetical protein POTOM_053284 [Populus tomentosa]
MNDFVLSGFGKMNFYNVRVPKVPGSGAIGTLIKIGVLGGLGLYGATNSLYNVDRGHRAIMFNRIADELKASRKQHGCLNSNIISFFIKQHGCLNSNIVSFFVSYNFLRLSGMLPASHGVVKIGLRVLTRPVADQLPEIYRTLGENYNDRVLPSIIHETLKSVAVSREMWKILIGFSLVSPLLLHSKQVAARDAERAKFIVEKAEQDKKSAVIRAEGEATSAQLIGQAIANNPAFITLRKIEAAREIAHTISNSANKVFLDSSDLLLNLQKMELENPRNK